MRVWYNGKYPQWLTIIFIIFFLPPSLSVQKAEAKQNIMVKIGAYVLVDIVTYYNCPFNGPKQ